MIGNIFLRSSFKSKCASRIIKVIMSLISITSWHIPPQWQKRFLNVVFIFKFFYDAIKWSYDHLYMYSVTRPYIVRIIQTLATQACLWHNAHFSEQLMRAGSCMKGLIFKVTKQLAETMLLWMLRPCSNGQLEKAVKQEIQGWLRIKESLVVGFAQWICISSTLYVCATVL